MTRNSNHTHPGAVLADMMKSAEMTAEQLSVVTGLSLSRVEDVLTQRNPVSPRVAARLGKIFGDIPIDWMKMQAVDEVRR